MKTKTCSRCKESKTITEFYKDGSKAGYRYICKVCDKARILNIQRESKKKWVEYLGGKCSRCGYNEYYGALDFHHLDPTKKDFNLSSHKLTQSAEEKIKAELEKCVLLCSNCHRLTHHAS